MNCSTFRPILALLCLVVWTSAAMAQLDPGRPDTVYFSGGPLIVGQSRPLTLTIDNDYAVRCYSIPVIFSTIDGGFARYDSIVYINRLADPSIYDYRLLSNHTNGLSPDTLHFGATGGTGLPPGNTPTAQVFFTGLTAGTILVDSGFVPPAGPLVFCGNPSESYKPVWIPATIQVQTGTQPPLLSLPPAPLKLVLGQTAQFSVSGSSPEGFPVTLSRLSFTDYDNDARFPANGGTLGSGNPAQFSWTPTSGDIGIWLVTFEVCDSSGSCRTGGVEIQVLQNSSFLLPFQQAEIPNVCHATGLLHGNFDSDLYPELYLSGTTQSYTNADEVYDYTPGGTLQLVHSTLPNPACPRYGPQAGYFNGDPYLDLLAMRLYGTQSRLVLQYGDGNNEFTEDIHNVGTTVRTSTLGEFTGDNYLDVAYAFFTGVTVFASDGAGNYTQSLSIPSDDSALTVNSADFNDDGHDDLAIGSTHFIRIYLGDGAGGFTLAQSYDQTYGSVDIEVTNQGSDFNNDNIFDLCISTPSYGGTSSKMMVYLGNGDGSFAQQTVRTVKGQIFGNTVGDFNGDGNLDIAYVNGAKRYAAILFGDGNGSFTNEVRYAIPMDNPYLIDALDIDLDGDVDLSVVATVTPQINSIFLLTNQLNPGGFLRKALDISAHDVAKLELVSSTGKILNEVRNTMPATALYKRNLDGNNMIDKYAVMGSVEAGEYTLSAKPIPGSRADQPFALEFRASDKLYRLAKDVVMPASGVNFGVCLDGNTNVQPQSGVFMFGNQPTFSWYGTGQFDFQLATDPGFVSPAISKTVSGNMYRPDTALAVTDTVSYFWRIKPHSESQYGLVYTINLMSGGSQICGDVDASGTVDISDAVAQLMYIFNGGSLANPDFGDVNCDQTIDISDVVGLILYIFSGGAAPCSGC